MMPSLYSDPVPESEPAFDDFAEDPDWLLARAVYLYPDSDSPDGRLVIRFDAAREMHRIERRYSRP